MRLFRRFNPFRHFGYDYTHPLLHYVVREIRGGRSPAGLNRYTRNVVIIVGLLIIAGLPVITVAVPWPGTDRDRQWYYGASLLYTFGAIGVSVLMFVITDAVTIFFAAMSVRTELGQPVKFDLLRTSPLLPGSYVASRLTVAQVRSWRVFVVMWAARMCTWGLLVAVGRYWDTDCSVRKRRVGLAGHHCPDGDSSVSTGFLIFSVMFLLEPVWRFRMMAELATSIAARVRQGVWMWFALGGAVAVVLFVQGMIAMLVVFVSRVIYTVIDRGFVWLPYDSESALALTAGFVPWIAMPFIVWAYQRRVTRWRRRVTEQVIFARHEEID